MAEENQTQSDSRESTSRSVHIGRAGDGRGEVTVDSFAQVKKLLLDSSNEQAEQLAVLESRERGEQENGETAVSETDTGNESGVETDSAGAEPKQDTQQTDDRQGETISPKTIKDLAAAAGIELKDLFDIELSFGTETDQTSATIGQLKDAFAKGTDLDERETQVTVGRQDLENETMRARGELQELMSMIDATPQMLERASAQYQETIQRERRALLAIVPEMKDEEVYARRHKGVQDLAGKYRITPAEIDNMSDHRAYKLLLDAVEWREQLNSADAEGKRLRKGARVGASKKQAGSKHGKTDKLIARAQETGDDRDRAAAVSALIGG